MRGVEGDGGFVSVALQQLPEILEMRFASLSLLLSGHLRCHGDDPSLGVVGRPSGLPYLRKPCCADFFKFMPVRAVNMPAKMCIFAMCQMFVVANASHQRARYVVDVH
jgi:hypothetical protein